MTDPKSYKLLVVLCVTSWCLLPVSWAIEAMGAKTREATQVDSSPIIAEPDFYDFGELPSNATKRCTISLRNTSDMPVRIGAVTTSCGCVSSGFAPVTLGGHETYSLTLTYEATGGPGPLTRRAYVHVSRPDGQNYYRPERIEIHAVITPLQAERSDVEPSSTPPNESLSRR